MCEDDINAAPDLPDALTAARRTERPVTLWLEKAQTHPESYLRLIDPGKGRYATSAPVGLYPVQRFKSSWYGSQCVYLPAGVVQRLTRASTFGVPTGNPIDRWLRDHLDGLLVALPNPVQHRSPPTVVGDDRHPRISPTFHLAREGSWEDAWPSSTTRT